MSLPLTLLAGPSVTGRDDLARCAVLRRPGLVAVGYDVEPAPTGLRLTRWVRDARGLQDRQDVELTGCCLSCTVREDAGPGLSTVVAADRWREVLLALPASLRPGPLVGAVEERGEVHVDTVTTLVDARLLRAQVSGGDQLADRGLAAAPTDRRSTAELVLGQVEDADVLAVADLHRTATAAARTVEALLAHLAPLAVRVPLGPGGAGVDDVVSTGRHSRDRHDRDRLTGLATDLAADLCPPECGVTTVQWSSDRPLHPGRLSDALPAVVAGVVRSRGHVALADRPGRSIRWESAGASLAFGDPVPGPAGCALLLTGVDLDGPALTSRLDTCLATATELAGPPSWEDPFEDALGPREHAS